LSLTVDWVALRSARPNTWDTASRNEWERADAKHASWAALKSLTSQALATKSKDVRLAVWLLEAALHVDGFAGVRDGIRVIRELLTRFWDAGLYPEIDRDDVETRTAPLVWLNHNLADAIREIPLTQRPAPGLNYSARYFTESRRANGLITGQEFDAAAAAGSPASYAAMKEDFSGAVAELTEFERLIQGNLSNADLSVAEAKDAFEECRRIINGILQTNQVVDHMEGGFTTSNGALKAAVPATLMSSGGGKTTAEPVSSWDVAEQLARSGDVDRALAQMTALANVEPNGRVRFHRKLVLAEICLNSRRQRLGKAILEELAELIDKHNLENWENSELVSSVWTRLYKCYVDESPSNAESERAVKLFERLCRLNPWQALACGERKV